MEHIAQPDVAAADQRVVDIDGLSLRVVSLTDANARSVAKTPNGPEVVPDYDAAAEGWEQ